MKSYLLDTNMLVRYLTGAPEKQAEKVRQLIVNNQEGDLRVVVIPLVVAECVFVLTGSVYRLNRKRVSDVLISFLQSPSLNVESRNALLKAFENFRDTNVDFVDAYLAALAETDSIGVASFDKDFARFPQVEIWT